MKKSMSNKSYLRKIPIEGLISNKWIEFDSAKDAALILNLNRSKVVLVCRELRKSTGGFKFRYKNNETCT